MSSALDLARIEALAKSVASEDRRPVMLDPATVLELVRRARELERIKAPSPLAAALARDVAKAGHKPLTVHRNPQRGQEPQEPA